ncbi:8915_t:CDS:2 [Rhizophagus irregularis]|nr:8915_t:CDS:2 [Rhizophagus irregularis]
MVGHKWDVFGRVALKSFEYSENFSKEYLQRLRALAKFEHENPRSIIRIYGMTKNPETNNYILIMKYVKCNLREYINKHFNTLSLSNKIELLVPISNGLKKIHQADMVHGNLHPGNILQTTINNPTEKNYITTNNSTKIYPMPQTWSSLSDLGLCEFYLQEKQDFFTSYITSSRRGWYWRLDPEMKHLMRVDDEASRGSRSGTPISPIKDNMSSGFSSPTTPGTPNTPNSIFTFSTPFTTSLSSSLSHSYSVANIPLTNSTTSSNTSSYGIIGYDIHPEAIYTSRLLEFDNLPQTTSY